MSWDAAALSFNSCSISSLVICDDDMAASGAELLGSSHFLSKYGLRAEASHQK